MAQIVIPIRDTELKDEILEAFASSFGNPEGLTNQQLAIKHISNFIRGVLNDAREKNAVETAKAGVQKEESLDS